MERESVQGERDCTGGRGFESETRGSQTRGSRCINATNAGFETRVQVRTRGERRREHELRVALIQERVDRVKELPRRGGEIRV